MNISLLPFIIWILLQFPLISPFVSDYAFAFCKTLQMYDSQRPHPNSPHVPLGHLTLYYALPFVDFSLISSFMHFPSTITPHLHAHQQRVIHSPDRLLLHRTFLAFLKTLLSLIWVFPTPSKCEQPLQSPSCPALSWLLTQACNLKVSIWVTYPRLHPSLQKSISVLCPSPSMPLALINLNLSTSND